MPNEPSPFMFAQALHVLLDCGQQQPNQDTAGLAFTATLLAAGYEQHELTKAIIATRATTTSTTANHGHDPFYEHQYTDDEFQQKFLEAMRPGIHERKSANKITWDAIKRRQDLDEVINQMRMDDQQPETVADQQLTDTLKEAVNHAEQALERHHTRTP